jgi:hypothetical protein
MTNQNTRRKKMGSKVSGRLVGDAKTRPMRFSDLDVGDFFQFKGDIGNKNLTAWLCVKTDGASYRVLTRQTSSAVLVTVTATGTPAAMSKSAPVVRHDVEFVLSGSVSEVTCD